MVEVFDIFEVRFKNKIHSFDLGPYKWSIKASERNLVYFCSHLTEFSHQFSQNYILKT